MFVCSPGFSQRRLAIVDLSPSGHGPLCDPSGRFWITYNGEVYNHVELRRELEGLGERFQSTSDTEVILAAYRHWGERSLDRLNGMFAFAIWDARLGRLFLARDRFGKKPLFLCEDKGILWFASEIKAILACPGVARELDTESVWEYFSYRYVPAPRTLLGRTHPGDRPFRDAEPARPPHLSSDRDAAPAGSRSTIHLR